MQIFAFTLHQHQPSDSDFRQLMLMTQMRLILTSGHIYV